MAHQPEEEAAARRLRVRTGKDFPVRFLVDLGQHNAVFVKRHLIPLAKLLRWADAFAFLPEPDYGLVHSFNAVPLLTRRPYLITFEDYLPRVPEDRYIGWLEDWLRRRLLSPRCVALLAMSEYALRQFRWQHRTFEGLKTLEAKLQVLYPAVALQRHEPKRASGKLRLLFVGADFMRKGGPALLRAHEGLRNLGVPVETTVVSPLRWSPRDYIGPASKIYVDKELRRLSQEGVTRYGALPHDEVTELMGLADYLVFPTLHDTFGFVSIEALACGTPVIATNTCAQPEVIEHERCGYLLPFDNDPHIGKWVWIYRNREPGYLGAYDQTIERLSQALVERLLQCWESGQKDYTRMSQAALDRVRSRFNREKTRAELERIYERCRGSNHNDG